MTNLNNLPNYLAELNDSQLKAAQTLQGPVLIQAGAGSGKTKTVIARIHNLIDHGIKPESILAITFTNKAANELKQRLPQEASGVTACTIHSLCVKILRAYPHLNDFNSNFTIIDTDDQRKVMRMAKDEYLNELDSKINQYNAQLRDLNTHGVSETDFANEAYSINLKIKTIREQKSIVLDYKERELLNYLPDYKSDMYHLTLMHREDKAKDEIKIELTKKDLKDPNTGKIKDQQSQKILIGYIEYILDYYTEYLHSHNMMDFDDLLYNTVLLLTDNPNDLFGVQSTFNYISVDEYQDVSDIQEDLIEKLADTKEQNLCVVGDPNQSIYGFRGAKVTNILQFAQHYQNAQVISIMHNYRSTQQILNAANDIIAHNPSAYKTEAKLDAVKEDGDLPIISLFNDDHEEADSIANQIADGIAKGNKPSDYAVLYRMNALSRSIESSLVKYSIPYEVIGGLAFYDRAEIKDLLAYLRLIVNHSDDLAFNRIINTPSRRIGTKTVTLIEKWAKYQTPHVSNFDMTEHSNFITNDKGKPLSNTIKQHLDSFVNIINQFNLNQPGKVSDVLNTLLTQFYKTYLSERDHNDPQVDSSRLANALQLVEAAKEFEQKQTQTLSLGESIANFVQEAAISASNDTKDDSINGKVQLMTIHASKGLEFDNVYIIGLENGVFPSSHVFQALKQVPSKDMYPTQHELAYKEAMRLLQEERRLMYVATTRAKKNLFMSGVKLRHIWGQEQMNQPSLFLKEIKPNNVRYFNIKTANQLIRKKVSNDFHTKY